MMGKAFCDIFLLTDGEVYNIDEVTELAGKHRDRARVFSFGIGYGPSHTPTSIWRVIKKPWRPCTA